jgi:hypothetical protein
MALFRRRVNKISKKLHSAKKKDKSVTWMTGDGPAGEIDINSVHKIIKLEKQLGKASNERKRGIKGALRIAQAPKGAKERIAIIKKIKELREKGLIVEKPREVAVKAAVIDKKVNNLFHGIEKGAKVRTISVRGNVREGRFVGAERGLVFLEMNGQKVSLKSNHLKSVKKI